ncbi:MAG: helix-turn-helix domain-containing protein, partial [Halobacteriales archaeon]|nr:helix-turn-helix domain-containing protein [Halobacteriales archaeon]
MDDPTPLPRVGDHRRLADDAFRLLADGTRLSILKALWDGHDPMDPSPMTFSELRERLGVDDPGRLNYHLGKLTTHFIRRTDDGYELREVGKRIMRVVVSGMAVDDIMIDPVQIDVSCIFCDGPTEIFYEDGFLAHRCTGCTSRCVVDYPPSVLSREELPPAVLLDRTNDEIYYLNRVWMANREESAKNGVCPECAGSMPVASIRICEDHDPDPTHDEVCETCGSIFWGMVYLVCDVCKFFLKLPTLMYPPSHPAVIAFYYDHGIEF